GARYAQHARAPALSRLKTATRPVDDQKVRSVIALALSVLAIAGVVLYASESQRGVADENYHEAIVARQLGADMLARENALNDYIESGRTDELVLMYEADRRLDSGLEHAKELSSDSP